MQRRGFTVLERDDTSNGELRAALGTFERRLIAADSPTSVVYVCGYGTGFDGRPFLLPVSASLQRDTDILAEGLIANFITDLPARAAPRLAVTLLDVFPRPGAPPPLADLLARSANAAAVTLAAIEPSSASAPTPFAEALVAEPASMVSLYGTANGFGWKLGDVQGAQIVTVSESVALQKANRTFLLFLGGLTLIFAVMLVLLNILLQRIVVRRVRLISRTAEEVSLGNMGAPELPVRGRDEIASLVESFNRMRRSLANALSLLGSD